MERAAELGPDWLTLARALLADFPGLVLDEPAEHLDLATADALTAGLLAAARGGTTVLITHRLAARSRRRGAGAGQQPGDAAGPYAALAAVEGPLRRMLERERETRGVERVDEPAARAGRSLTPHPTSLAKYD